MSKIPLRMDFLENASVAFEFPSPGFPTFHEIPGMVWVGNFSPNPIQPGLGFSQGWSIPAPLENRECRDSPSWISAGINPRNPHFSLIYFGNPEEAENSRGLDERDSGSNLLRRKSVSSLPVPGRAEGNSREDLLVSKDFPIFEEQSRILPGTGFFPVFPGKEAASRGHTIYGDGILLPALPEALSQEDKWRQEATFLNLGRVGNGIWDPSELP